jgi:hypothetical protein
MPNFIGFLKDCQPKWFLYPKNKLKNMPNFIDFLKDWAAK